MLQTLFHKYNLGWDPMGRSSLMCLWLCSKALRTERKTQEKVRKEKERIWKEKRRDEGAAYWGDGVHCEWLMRQGFWVHLLSNKNGLIHPFLSRRTAEPRSSDRSGFWKFLFNGRFSQTQKQLLNTCQTGIFPSAALFWSLLSYLCLVPVSLMLGLFTYLQMHTLYCVISHGDHPLSQCHFPCRLFLIHAASWLPFSSPFLHSAVFCLFFLYLNTEWPLLVVNVLAGCNFTYFSWLGDIRREISLALARL